MQETIFTILSSWPDESWLSKPFDNPLLESARLLRLGNAHDSELVRLTAQSSDPFILDGFTFLRLFNFLNAGDYLSFDVYSQSIRWVDPTCCFAEIVSSQLLLLSGQYSSLLKINYSNSSGSELILNSKIAAYLGMADFNKAKSLLDIDTNTDSGTSEASSSFVR